MCVNPSQDTLPLYLEWRRFRRIDLIANYWLVYLSEGAKLETSIILCYRQIGWTFNSTINWTCFCKYAAGPVPEPSLLPSRQLYSCCCCSVPKLYLTLCDPMDCSTPGFPVLYHLPEFAQTHVHWVSDAVQPSHPLSSPSPPAFNLSQQQGLFQWVSSLHQVAKVLEFQLQYQSFQWICRTDFL